MGFGTELEAPMQMPSGKYSLKLPTLEKHLLLISEVGYIVEDLTEK
ncbi:MAG: hypothetical protein IPQ28_12195 [Sphingobacteriales bacterium]|nr:hypothetical protein [Sphingobacteriales bacterium]